MITEIVQFDVQLGREVDFEKAMIAVRQIILRAHGCKGMQLLRSIETPASYRLLVQWQTKENNTVDFRQSPDYKEMGRLVRDYFAGKPFAGHFHTVV